MCSGACGAQPTACVCSTRAPSSFFGSHRYARLTCAHACPDPMHALTPAARRFVVALNATAEVAPGAHWLVVAASAGSLSAACNVTVTVTNVNDAPTIVAPPAQLSVTVPETLASGGLVTQLDLVDPDAGQALVCSVASTVCLSKGQPVDVQVGFGDWVFFWGGE
jgi:hypothetical protein